MASSHQTRLGPDVFLERFGELVRTENKISVTQKRVSEGEAHACLVRLAADTASGRLKIATLVPSAEFHAFSREYSELWRASLVNILGKKKKPRRETKKILKESLPKVYGAKRGAGRKKRQRQVRALQQAIKLRTAREAK